VSSLSFQRDESWQAEGKNVFITGASAGIGAELSRCFARAGVANLALVARNKQALEKVAQECQELGAGNVHIYPCDLTKNAEIKSATEKAVDDLGGFDVVVFNAGRSQGHYFEEIKDVEQIDYLLKLNISGAINTCHYLLPSVFKSRHSRLVIISSTAGIIPVPYRTVYCASKYALTGFSDSLRMELQDTYKENAPKICLVNFPEVSGTRLNTSRLDFGADEPPFGFDGSNTIPVEIACSNLMGEIAKGTREWGQPLKVTILRPFYSIMPSVLERIIMKHVKTTHIRQLDKGS
jgi:NADP-dependent 3-hydroxy acid dehydrogenase YdfG